MLLAQFVGIVHEIKPNFLKRDKKYRLGDDHLHPALIALGYLTPNAKDILRSFNRRKYKIVVAENFDIRLSAAAKASDLSPFVGNLSELLSRASGTEASSAQSAATCDDDIEFRNHRPAKSMPILGRHLSDDEIPF